MPEPLIAALLIMVAAAVVAVGLPLVLRRLPEPPAPQPGDGDSSEAGSGALVAEPAKIAYADLARPGFVAACSLAAAGAAAIGVFWVPPHRVALWLVLAVFGVALAGIDWATTWLPMRLSYAGWIAMAAATVGTAFVHADPGMLLRAVAGAAIAGVVYLAIWVVSRGGFGFGDVRFAPLLGAAAGSQSWTLLLWGLLCGALLGGLFGAIRIIAGRRGGFPYAPAMLSGVYLAAVLSLPSPLG